VKKYKTKWYGFIKKLLKTREEIEMDAEYIVNGSKLSKILTADHLATISAMIPNHQSLLWLLRNIDDSLKAALIATVMSLLKQNATEMQPLAVKSYLISAQSAHHFNQNPSEFNFILTSTTIDKQTLIESIASRADFLTNLNTSQQHELIDTYINRPCTTTTSKKASFTFSPTPATSPSSPIATSAASPPYPATRAPKPPKK
jgi:hypothetical protein